MPGDVEVVAARFAIRGRLVDTRPFGTGHINDSFLVTCDDGGEVVRYLLQRIKDAVFHDPPAVMENIQRVTNHIAAKLASQGADDIERRVLVLVPTGAGEPYCRDERGSYWRLYPFVEGTHYQDTVRTPADAYKAGRAFGTFQRLLADLPEPPLRETIPRFHDTPLRFEALEHAVQANPCGRAADCKAEIDFALGHRALASTLLDLHAAGEISQRVVHNDAKINNVLFDDTTGDALCVVDLDTVMPGLSLYDFGDMVRSMTSTGAEDERDLSKVELEMPLFESLARGYLEAAGEFLTPPERNHLVTAGKLITLEQGIRFLTDFLNGDKYYKTRHSTHNLDRCRTQFKLLRSAARQEVRMRQFTDSL